ncbi:11318_t:CDS:1 [Entrophospora sp. SA101]|nr:11318_t:CDS:1 [Entrophospora sp. SA101]
MNLAQELLYHCIDGIADSRHKSLVLNDPSSTVENLERDAHVILSSNPHDIVTLYIKMPIFFLSLYNDVLKILEPTILEKTLISMNQNISWNEWEKFVAYYITFHTNLLTRRNYQTITLRDLHNNAYGTQKTLGIVVKLKELSVIQAHGQFPCENLVDKNRKHIDWMKGDHLIINGTSAKFADSFVVRDILGCNKYLLEAFQNKLSINAQQCTIKDFHKGINKNLESLYNSDGLFADYHIVTILFTTQPFDGDVADLDEDFLLISKENFAAYFGPVFSTRAMLSITNDINPNFSGWDMIKNNIPGAGDLTTTNIVSKRPYKSEEDLFNKHPRIKNAMDQFPSAKRPKLNFYPFSLE